MPDPNSDMAAALQRYPNSDDVAFARQQDYSYGQPYAGPWFGGGILRTSNVPFNKIPKLITGQSTDKPIPTKDVSLTNSSAPQLADYYAKAALASNRSALATLGFDPKSTAADVSWDPKGEEGLNILGAFNPVTGQIYANALEPSSIAHESIHRGIDRLRESPYWNQNWPSFDDRSPGGPFRHEMFARALMNQKMGDPEGSIGYGFPAPLADEQRKQAINYFNNDYGPKAWLTEMEAAAAKYLASKNPRGPH